MGNKKGLVCLFASFVLLLASCSNGMLDFASGKKSSGDNSTVKSEKAYLVIGSANVAEISEGGSRTVFTPNEIGELTDFVLTGSLQGSETEKIEETAANLEELKGKTIELVSGTWNFTLSAKLEGVEFVGKRESLPVRGGTASQPVQISFMLESTIEYGGMSVCVEFEDPSNGVDYVEAVLSKYDADVLNLIETKTLSARDTDGTVLPSVTYERLIPQISSDSPETTAAGLESGVYRLVFNFYSENGDTPLMLNSIPYVVYVTNGITSRYTEEDINLNSTYTITYYDNGGSIKSGVKTFKYSRKTGDITLPQMKKDGLYFTGWYTDSSFTTEPFSVIKKGTAKNLTLYARYSNSASGSISYDNNTFKIEIEGIDGTPLSNGVYLNDSIKLCARDSYGNLVTTEGFEVSILYKGKKIEDLKQVPAGSFYQSHIEPDSEGYGTLEFLGKTYDNEDMLPVPAENYQLVISAFANVDNIDIGAKDTFPITVKNMIYYSFDYPGDSGTALSDTVSGALLKDEDGALMYPSTPVYVKFKGIYDSYLYGIIGELLSETGYSDLKNYKVHLDLSEIEGVSSDIPLEWLKTTNCLYGLRLPAEGSIYGIGNKAFYTCQFLSEVTIPALVNYIAVGEDVGAFYGCSGLKRVVFDDPDNWYKSSTVVDVSNADAVAALKIEANKVDFSDPENNAGLLSGYTGDSLSDDVYYLYYLK